MADTGARLVAPKMTWFVVPNILKVVAVDWPLVPIINLSCPYHLARIRLVIPIAFAVEFASYFTRP
jgi:hypothetical protein